jgi:hypothetical protein
VVALFFVGIISVFNTNTAQAGFWSIVLTPFAESMKAVFELILIMLFNVVGFLVAIATVIFAWVLKPENFASMMNMVAVKNVWIMVRDLLNMAFILVLLFAAFCTVFQVEKWNLKKVWLGVLLNALLVNFSFPIARFFIDISNVIMYYFLNSMFGNTGGDGILTTFLAGTQLANAMQPPSGDIPFLVMAIIFTFIFGMTMLVLAIMFLVRLIALTMIVMFSPIGFVGYIFPATHKYADMWWGYLMRYAFFGPAMVFMMMVALSVMKEVQANQVVKFAAISANNVTPELSTFIGDAAFMSIPLVILWFGMGIAQSFGIEGAATVTAGAKKWGGKVAMGLSGGAYLKKNWEGFSKARKSRQEEIDKKRWGAKLGGKANDIQDKYGSLEAQKRYNKRKEAENKDDIKNKAEAKETIQTKDKIDKVRANAARPAVTDEQRDEHAADAKAAMNDKNYMNEKEKEFKVDMKANFADVSRTEFDDLRTKKSEHRRFEYDLETHDARRAALVDPPAGASQEELARHQITIANMNAERQKVKEAMDKAYKAVEAEEKKVIQEMKTDHQDELQKMVQVGEDVGKTQAGRRP